MPRGTPQNWTREQLELIQELSGRSAIEAFATEVGSTYASIYSVKARIKDFGIDGILERQAHRHETYGAAYQPTLAEQMAQIYTISVSRGGRRDSAQYSLTIPARLGELWVERWGRQIRFEALDDGVKIKPIKLMPPPDLPAWLKEDGA